MIPSAIIMLDHLPITENGKVDRHALPAPHIEQRTGSPVQMARTATESRIAAIFGDVLGVERVGANDDFFALGGTSLLAAQLMARLETEFGVLLPLAELFRGATAGHLATQIAQSGQVASWQCLIPLLAQGFRPPLFLIHSLRGNIIGYRTFADHLPSNLPVYGIQAVGLNGKDAPLVRVEDMATRYISEITEVFPEGPYFIGGFSFGGTVAYEVARQLIAAGKPVAFVGIIDNVYAVRPETLRERFDLWIQRQIMWAEKHRAKMREHDNPLRYLLGRLLKMTSRTQQVLRRRFRVHHDRPGTAQHSTQQDVSRYNRLAYFQYSPEPCQVQITLFLAQDGRYRKARNPQTVWEKVALGGVNTIMIPGDHFAMIQEPYVRDLAASLDHCLREAGDQALTQEA